MTRLFPPDQRQRLLDRVMAGIADPRKLNEKRERSYPRVVKRARHNSYRVKKPGQHGIRHDAPATIKLVNPVLTRDNTRIAALLKTS
jgi:hypothetical protein